MDAFSLPRRCELTHAMLSQRRRLPDDDERRSIFLKSVSDLASCYDALDSYTIYRLWNGKCVGDARTLANIHDLARPLRIWMNEINQILIIILIKYNAIKRHGSMKVLMPFQKYLWFCYKYSKAEIEIFRSKMRTINIIKLLGIGKK